MVASPFVFVGTHFYIDFLILLLVGFDIVLGVHWLLVAYVGPMVWDFDTPRRSIGRVMDELVQPSE